MDGRDDGTRALHDGRRETGVVEVTDPLLDPGQHGGTARASYDGTHHRTPFDQGRADARAHETVGSGDDNDGWLGGA